MFGSEEISEREQRKPRNEDGKKKGKKKADCKHEKESVEREGCKPQACKEKEKENEREKGKTNKMCCKCKGKTVTIDCEEDRGKTPSIGTKSIGTDSSRTTLDESGASSERKCFRCCRTECRNKTRDQTTRRSSSCSCCSGGTGTDESSRSERSYPSGSSSHGAGSDQSIKYICSEKIYITAQNLYISDPVSISSPGNPSGDSGPTGLGSDPNRNGSNPQCCSGANIQGPFSGLPRINGGQQGLNCLPSGNGGGQLNNGSQQACSQQVNGFSQQQLQQPPQPSSSYPTASIGFQQQPTSYPTASTGFQQQPTSYQTGNTGLQQQQQAPSYPQSNVGGQQQQQTYGCSSYQPENSGGQQASYPPANSGGQQQQQPLPSYYPPAAPQQQSYPPDTSGGQGQHQQQQPTYSYPPSNNGQQQQQQPTSYPSSQQNYCPPENNGGQQVSYFCLAPNTYTQGGSSYQQDNISKRGSCSCSIHGSQQVSNAYPSDNNGASKQEAPSYQPSGTSYTSYPTGNTAPATTDGQYPTDSNPGGEQANVGTVGSHSFAKIRNTSVALLKTVPTAMGLFCSLQLKGSKNEQP